MARGVANNTIPQIVEPSEDAFPSQDSAAPQEREDASSNQQDQVNERPESPAHQTGADECPAHQELRDEDVTLPKVPLEQNAERREERGHLLARPFLLQVDTLPARNRTVQDVTFGLIFICFIAFLVSLDVSDHISMSSNPVDVIFSLGDEMNHISLNFSSRIVI